MGEGLRVCPQSQSQDSRIAWRSWYHQKLHGGVDQRAIDLLFRHHFVIHIDNLQDLSNAWTLIRCHPGRLLIV